MQYSFILQDNTQKAYRLFTWFLIFFHLAAVGIIEMNGTATQTRAELFAFFILLSVSGLLYYFFRKQKTWMDALGISLALLCFVFWERNAGLPAAIIIGLLFILVMTVRKKKTIVFISEEGIVVKRIFNRTTYAWENLDNLVLKDGLLTIDLLSNKMIQAELSKENELVDEKQFNLFCRQYLPNKN
ncbi:MAG TPA: hypothetical protein PKC54_15190 [Ferruginibacter sp.]|nr:hypothetical protein [Ferruginibacter sp.]